MLEIEEVKVEEPKEKKPEELFAYVTIPTKEYKKMIRKIEQLKAQNAIQKSEAARESYRDRAWAAEAQISDLKKNLEDAKLQIQELLGIKELKDVAEQA